MTPAHDHNDYEVGKRHNLQFITIIDENGTMTAECGPQFAVSFFHLPSSLFVSSRFGMDVFIHISAVFIQQGMKRFHARKAVLEALTKAGLYVDTKDNPMVVPTCRCVLIG